MAAFGDGGTARKERAMDSRKHAQAEGMIESLLVPLDGSEVGERALPYARALAQATGARVLLVRVVWEDPAQGDARSDAQAYLQQVAEELGRSGVIPQVEILEGDAAEAISLEARRRGADLIVMTTHGRTGVGRWLYGSVAEGVLRLAEVPVLLARAWQDPTVADRIADHPRIMVPLDGSPFAERALPVAERLADALHGELALVRAVPAPDLVFGPDRAVWPLLESEIQAGAAEAQSYLEGLARQMAERGRSVMVEVCVSEVGETVGKTLADAARRRDIGLMVMSTHGFTGIKRLLLGSTAEEVLHVGATPLVMVPPRAATAASPQDGEGHVPADRPRLSLQLGAEDASLIRTALAAYARTLPADDQEARARVARLLDQISRAQGQANKSP